MSGLNPEERTVDPTPLAGDERPAPARPFVELLFHADLRRVGDRLEDGLLDSGMPVQIGRTGPRFGAAPLGDPTISRHQLELTWVGDRFRVRPLGRRPLRVVGLDGSAGPLRAGPGLDGPELHGPVLHGPAELAPGTLLAVGDRALLWLGLETGPRPPEFGMVGRSAPLDALRDRLVNLGRLAPRVVRVHGESGSGKELVARTLHRVCARPGAWVPVNCATLPPELADSQLFGHTRGAFTGATRSERGLIRAADRGTLFLDEVAELSPSVQARLLRVLEEREVRPVGALRAEPVDVLVVVASAVDLAAEVVAGRFREDLFARIESPLLRVPPLRQRGPDIARLFAHFAVDHGLAAPVSAGPCAVPLSLLRCLLGQPWPRNVRQLASVVRQIALDGPAAVEAQLRAACPQTQARRSLPAEVGSGGLAQPAAQPVAMSQPAAAAQSVARSAVQPRGAAEPTGRVARPSAARLRALLQQHAFVQGRVARALGVNRSTLAGWMKAHGLRLPSDIPVEELEAALEAAGGDRAAAARALEISERGLTLRLRR